MGNEPILINNSVVGRVKTAGQGYTLNKAIAYAYLPIEYSNIGTRVEVEMFGVKKSAIISAEPLFDPQGERIKS
jgi:4-methylaminobutanoate oxidase (formaldehyde-forming)